MAKRDSDLSSATEAWITICVFIMLGLVISVFVSAFFASGKAMILAFMGISLGAVFGVLLAQIRIVRRGVATMVLFLTFWWP